MNFSPDTQYDCKGFTISSSFIHFFIGSYAAANSHTRFRGLCTSLKAGRDFNRETLPSPDLSHLLIGIPYKISVRTIQQRHQNYTKMEPRHLMMQKHQGHSFTIAGPCQLFLWGPWTCFGPMYPSYHSLSHTVYGIKGEITTGQNRLSGLAVLSTHCRKMTWARKLDKEYCGWLCAVQGLPRMSDVICA